MKTIGLLGGMSWESTAVYYRLINQGINTRLGGLHSASILLNSLDFAPMEEMQVQGRWEESAEFLANAARGLEAAGADFLLICTNTMHKVAGQVQAAVGIPLLHIADATASAILDRGLRRVGLLGTRFTMEEDFYRGRLTAKFNLEVVVPPLPDREVVHRVIYQELCLGRIVPQSKSDFIRIMKDLGNNGAEGIILGCTEISMLVSPTDYPLPLFDTTALHAAAAVDMALGN